MLGRRSTALLLVFVCTAAALALSGLPALARDTPAKPNVILISIDTLRASEMDLYGGRAKTPRMDQFARSGVWFTDFTANGSWTRPTFASMFTSLYPSTHGATRKRDPETGKEIWSKPLAPSFTTMAEIFKSNGYHTAAIGINPQCGPVNGFAQGFDEFHNDVDSDLKKRYPHWTGAEAMHAQFSRWLDQNRATNQPVFAWFHFMDPHAPYEPPASYARKWVGSYYPEAVKKKLGWVTGWTPAERKKLTPEDVKAIRGLYTAEVEYVDEYVGRVLDDLKRIGWYDKSIVIILADHGEEIFEHEQDPAPRRKLYAKTVGHGNAHYELLVRVPLMIHYPGAKPRKVTGIAADVDLLPTVMDLAQVHSPAEARFEGKSLVPAMKGRASLKNRIAFISTVPNNPGLWSMKTSKYKLIYHVKEGVAELYNYIADPGETRDLASKERKTVNRLLAILKQHMNRSQK